VPNSSSNTLTDLLKLLAPSSNTLVGDLTSFAPAPGETAGTNTASSETTSELTTVFKNMSDQAAQINQQLVQVLTASQAHVDTLSANTQALLENTSARGTGTSVASTVGNFAESLFGGGSLLAPIISGIMGLFGGGSEAAAPVLVPYIAPSPIQFSASVGMPSGSPAAASGSTTQLNPASQVQVNINALDSKSFLDHSDDIAQAVRQAILYSNSLNDVIADL